MTILNYFIWNIDPEIFTIPLIDRPIRWYGLLFALGFMISQQILLYIYRKEGKPEKDVETLTIYMIVATILGARLGHVFFYEPDKYLSNPIDILKIWEGGLASHGAAFGILFALWVYSRYDISIKSLSAAKGAGLRMKRVVRPGQSYLQIVDRIVIVVALTGCLIRLGNFMNSEIYGVPTGSNFGVIFARNVEQAYVSPSSPIEELALKKDDTRASDAAGSVPLLMELTFKDEPEVLYQESLDRYLTGRFKQVADDYNYVNEHIILGDEIKYRLFQDSNGVFRATVNAFGIARHPTQLYESLTSLAIFLLLLFIWYRKKEHTPAGLLLGLFLIILFGLRFVHELFKENQVNFEDGMALNMGQILSIPLVVAGILIFLNALRKNKTAEPGGD